MSIKMEPYSVREETYLKLMILCHGIEFSANALQVALYEKAKGQNLVYNMPLNASLGRPQEIIIKNLNDGYEVVVSCVAPNPKNKPVWLDVKEGKLKAYIDAIPVAGIEIHYVKEPEYYAKLLGDGKMVKKYITACGLDELNILPWKGCAISQCCRFCGINNFVKKDELSAQMISRNKYEWTDISDKYLKNLEEAILIAKKSDCYKEHAHVILIAGNLDNESLDYESEIFCQIASRIVPLVEDISTEGIVAVITPPRDKAYIDRLKDSGISKVVFNLEAITKNEFVKYCPGKADLGYEFFVDRLIYAINAFGEGSVWTNLVYGLEDKEKTLKACKKLIKKGIVISANVLHLDKGNTVDCDVPSVYDVLDFFYRLEAMNASEGFTPFYCSKALRTSLSNEAHDLRIEVN